MCDCVMRACMPVAHANARTRTLGSPIARTRPCIVQHLFAALCILQEPEMMPHEPEPADISASIRYCEPVLPLTSVSPVSPAIRAPPHGTVMPPFASWICAGAPFVLIEEPIMEPLIIDLLQPSSLGYVASGRAASAATAASSHPRAVMAPVSCEGSYTIWQSQQKKICGHDRPVYKSVSSYIINEQRRIGGSFGGVGKRAPAGAVGN